MASCDSFGLLCCGLFGFVLVLGVCICWLCVVYIVWAECWFLISGVVII